MTVRLAVANDVLTMQVEDVGRSFDPAAPRVGEGLSRIQRRLKALGGTAHWQSALGRGAMFTVMIPLRR
jgi:signal transduction histidine kinase